MAHNPHDLYELNDSQPVDDRLLSEEMRARLRGLSLTDLTSSDPALALLEAIHVCLGSTRNENAVDLFAFLIEAYEISSSPEYKLARENSKAPILELGELCSSVEIRFGLYGWKVLEQCLAELSVSFDRVKDLFVIVQHLSPDPHQAIRDEILRWGERHAVAVPGTVHAPDDADAFCSDLLEEYGDSPTLRLPENVQKMVGWLYAQGKLSEWRERVLRLSR